MYSGEMENQGRLYLASSLIKVIRFCTKIVEFGGTGASTPAIPLRQSAVEMAIAKRYGLRLWLQAHSNASQDTQ